MTSEQIEEVVKKFDKDWTLGRLGASPRKQIVKVWLRETLSRYEVKENEK